MEQALLYASLLGLILLANVVEARGTEHLKRRFTWVLLFLNLPLFLTGLAFLLTPIDRLQASPLSETFSAFRPAGVVILVAATWGLLVALPEVRRLLARWLPLDPYSPVHALALVLAGYLVGNTIVTLSQGGLENLAETARAPSIAQVLILEFLYASAGIIGVGLLIRRDTRKALDRLGLESPTWEQLKRALQWAGLLVLLQLLVNALFYVINQEQAKTLQDVTRQLYGNMDTLGEWFLLALSAGIGEEILFRGAIQPVFGLWATSFLFALAHGQYGFTLAMLALFIIGFILGMLRRRYNTTTAIATHFAYNFILGILALLAQYAQQFQPPAP